MNCSFPDYLVDIMIVHDEIALVFSTGNSSRCFWQKHLLELPAEEDKAAFGIFALQFHDWLVAQN